MRRRRARIPPRRRQQQHRREHAGRWRWQLSGRGELACSLLCSSRHIRTCSSTRSRLPLSSRPTATTQEGRLASRWMATLDSTPDTASSRTTAPMRRCKSRVSRTGVSGEGLLSGKGVREGARRREEQSCPRGRREDLTLYSEQRRDLCRSCSRLHCHASGMPSGDEGAQTEPVLNDEEQMRVHDVACIRDSMGEESPRLARGFQASHEAYLKRHNP
mmetsp:Transcript_36300/g.73239  ORF Transcript_36300/g.73239 Transcript_36300/m.73239 type:complete len:217 (+) Transcript_36300:127-777(+)